MDTEGQDVWDDTPARMAKRRGVLGIVVWAALLITAAAIVPLGDASPVITVFAVATATLSVLVFFVSMLALSFSRRNNNVLTLHRLNSAAAGLALVVGLAAIVLEVVYAFALPVGTYVGALMIVVVLIVTTAAVLVLAAANRAAFRAES